MLKNRVLTAIVLIPIFLAILFLLPPTYFLFITAVIVILAMVEWLNLAEIKQYYAIYLIFGVILLYLSLFIPVIFLLCFTVIAWLFGSYLVLTFPRTQDLWGRNRAFRLSMGIIALIPCWIALNFIRQSPHGVFELLFLFLLIWGADTAAFFVGKKWGQHKLAPKVSPGKSIEGAIGALVMAGIITLIVGLLRQWSLQKSLFFLVLAMITVLFSILGDLFESMLKRNAGMKDSGNILPGHGGILDRIDSLTSAAPIFAVGLVLAGTAI